MNISALLAGLLSGILGSMGLGGGGVLIIYLTLFTDTEQLTAQGINLLFFIPTAIIAVVIYSIRKEIKWKMSLTIALFGILGAVIGITLSSHLGGELTSKIFGAGLVLFGLWEIFKRTPKTVAEKEK